MTEQVKTEENVVDMNVNTDNSVQNAENTQVNTAGEDVANEKVESMWPDDWREKLSGDDEKMQKHLSRFNSINDIAKSNLELREKISKGEYKRATEAPTDDEVALKDWRSENGIPESPEKYSMPEGIIVGEEDKPMLNEFLKTMHDKNAPDSVVKDTVDWYFKLQEQRLSQEAQLDKQQKVETEEALRKEWGSEYRSNYAEVENFVKSRFPEYVTDALLSMPETVTALAAISREINPAITMFPNSQNAGQSLVDEIKSIEEKMHSSEYKNNPKMQQRYQELLSANLKMHKK